MVRFAAGVKVAFVPSEVTAPETSADPCFKVKFSIVIVEGSIPTLNIAEILLLMAIPVVLFTGSVDVTVGAKLGASLSFLQPAINTINSIAMIGNTFFLSFIFVYFNYFKLKKTSQNKGKSVNSGKCYIFLEKSYIIH